MRTVIFTARFVILNICTALTCHIVQYANFEAYTEANKYTHSMVLYCALFNDGCSIQIIERQR